jgi:hypothetical protein
MFVIHKMAIRRLLPLVIFVNLNMIATSLIVDAKTFKPLLFKNGTAACAKDSPAAVIPLSEIQIGIPPGVPDSARCAFCCKRFNGCTSFNHRWSQDSSVNGGRCELFTMFPRNCSVIDDSCQHYQVGAVQLTTRCIVMSSCECAESEFCP